MVHQEHGNVAGLARRVQEFQVPAGCVTTWWLGGSGFIFKTAGGSEIWIDPYLSDVVRATFGLGRAFPAPILAEEARPDVIIATHWHEDHLDPVAIPTIARVSPNTRFVMPPSAMSRALSWGLRRSRITPLSWGQTVEIAGAKITSVPARHDAGIAGWEVPDAMGVILEVDGLKIYNTGDTEYDLRLRMLKSQKVDVIQACINGVGGNMNAHEAAMLAWQLGAKLAIPMHHLLWATNPAGDEATLDPELFATTYARLGGVGQVVIPSIGEAIRLTAN